MLTHSASLRHLAGVIYFAVHCHVFERCSVPVAAVTAYAGAIQTADDVVDPYTLMIVFNEDCNADIVKKRALRNSLRQPSARLRAGQPFPEHATTAATEGLRISARRVASYEAYTRALIRLTFPEDDASGIANERFLVSCTVNDEMLHKVNINILSLLDCPKVEKVGLKRALEDEPCVRSVEFSQQVRIAVTPEREADGRQPLPSSRRALYDFTVPSFASDSHRTFLPLVTASFAPDKISTAAEYDLRLAEHNVDCLPHVSSLAQHLTASSVFFDPAESFDPPFLCLQGYRKDYVSDVMAPEYMQYHTEQRQEVDLSLDSSPSPVSSDYAYPPSQYWRDIAGFSLVGKSVSCHPSEVVAVVDTGIALNHPYLRKNLWVNAGEVPNNNVDDDENGYIDDVYGFNFADDSGDVEDDSGHGTHCAGIIGAERDEHTGTQGVCDNVSIAALKFLNSNGLGFTANAVKALNYALQMKFPISSHSWGGADYSPALKAAIQKAGTLGHLVIAAAGNSGMNLDAHPFYPASIQLPNVIAVAASDRRDHIASFSNTGAHTVHVAAPGVGVVSTFPPNTFKVLSGTSVATPVVSGLAALLWAVPHRKNYAKIKEAIIKGVDKLPSAKGRLISGGRINAAKSIEWLLKYEAVTLKQPPQWNDDEEAPILAIE